MRTARKSTVLILTFAVAFCLVGLSVTAHAQDVIVRWAQINGITSPSNVVGTGATSGVNFVTGYNEPWSVNWGPFSWGIGGGAKVDLTTGEVEFFVHGLALAGGDYIGTTTGVPEVYAAVVCNDWSTTPPITVGTSFVFSTSATPVTLSPEGNAYYSGTLTSLANNVECTTYPTNIAFLIVDSTTGNWIAYGAVPVAQGKHHHW